jgi:predicted phosphoribosyltransferase
MFRDRMEAGRMLAEALTRFRGPQTMVLGIPRGGIVVAAEAAAALGAPLDVIIARKIGAPMQPELAIGAVISGDHLRILDRPTIEYLQVPREHIEQETSRQLDEISRRMTLYRGDRPMPDLRGKTVIVVDDGIATGYTIRAALQGLRRLDPGRLVLAVPVAPPSVCQELRELADDVVCLQTPDPFLAVGYWYDDFEQTTDAEVRELLQRYAAARPAEAAAPAR